MNRSRHTCILLALLGCPCFALTAEPVVASRFALVVGVNQYEHPKLDRLRYAENDAAELAAALQRSGHTVTLLVTGDAESAQGKPTRRAIDRRLTEMLAGCTRGDTVIVALSGHGVQFDGEDEAFFCPSDAVPVADTASRKTLLSLTALYRQLDASKASVKLLLVDACRNDPTLARSTGISLEAPRLPKGTAVLFSCSAGERAFEHDNYRHGIFFHHVLEGLRGKARNDEGHVTWDRLVEYVKRHVARDVPKLIRGGAQQSPVLFTGGLAGEPPVLVPAGSAPSLRASLDLFFDCIDRVSARRAGLPLKLQPLITFVTPGGGADRMGVQAEDIVLGVNGRDDPTSDDLDAILRDLTAGERVTLDVLRNGRKLTLTGTNETPFAEPDLFRRVRQEAEAKEPWAMDALAWLHLNGLGTAEDEREAARWFRLGSAAGCYSSQRWLATLLAEGRGVEKDLKEALRWYRKAADQGDAEAQNYLGVLHENGEGVPADAEEAVEWYRRAADQGHSYGLLNLGKAYLAGFGTEKDEKKGHELLRRAARLKRPEACVALGDAYADGVGVEADAKEAFRWYRKAADQNDPEGQNKLGVCYEDGLGVEPDINQAADWYRKSAEQNFSYGLLNLGLCYWGGTGVARDEKKALELFRRAAEQKLGEACTALGHAYAEGKGVDRDDPEALAWFRKGADLNDADAFNMLGVFHEAGRGIAENPRKAATFYRQAAERGHATGQYNYAQCLLNGWGVKENADEAYRWFRKSADQNLADAENLVGRCFEEGWGVKKDPAEAFAWYRRAAEQGLAVAQYNLALCYHLGFGVKKNLGEARTWYRKATEQGHEDARKALEDLDR